MLCEKGFNASEKRGKEIILTQVNLHILLKLTWAEFFALTLSQMTNFRLFQTQRVC